MLKRIFDILFSLVMIILLSPLLLMIVLIILLDDPVGGVIFRQERVGKNGIPFRLLKFRTMRPAAERGGQLTVGARDPRITRAGYYLRKYKVDELPQLFNVLVGDMSVVGPRPEVPRYVALYSPEQRQVLEIKPGITDYASLEYFAESELLARSPDPEKTYIEEVMPAKLKLNLQYRKEMNLLTDIKIILKTGARIVS